MCIFIAELRVALASLAQTPEAQIRESREVSHGQSTDWANFDDGLLRYQFP